MYARQIERGNGTPCSFWSRCDSAQVIRRMLMDLNVRSRIVGIKGRRGFKDGVLDVINSETTFGNML
jgi:hypothetical protein